MIDAVLAFVVGDALGGIVVFHVVVVLVVLSNAFLLTRPGRVREGAKAPLVSLLVPARNEEENIGACVRSLLAQAYPHLELLVLDERSEDGTRAILEGERARDGRLVVLTGEEPPPGWTGKNWACHRLSVAASGEILLFADADTIFVHRDAVGGIVEALETSRADLLSGLPRQVLGTFGEALLVPMVYWSLFSFTPLALARVWRRAPIARAVGQLMAFRRRAYDAVGGHAAVGASVVDDIDLARRVAAAGLVWRLLDATTLVECRMYRSGREAADGFSRNVFAAFGYAILPYLFVWGWLAYAVLVPVVVAALHLALPERVPVEPGMLVAALALSLFHWTFTYARLRLPLWPALTYPLTIVAFVAVAIRSFAVGARRRATWKGRPVERPPTRWV
jgi:chlorobactene glucosyltransferase